MEVDAPAPPCVDDEAVRAITATTTTHNTTNNNDEDEGEVKYKKEAGEDDPDESTLRVLLSMDDH